MESRRPSLLGTVLQQHIKYIETKYGCPHEVASQIARKYCRERYKPLTAIIQETKVDGKPEIKAVDLAQFWENMAGNLVSPSGSFYCQQEKKLSTTVNMIIQRLAERKMHKKLMLKAKAAGNFNEEMKHYYMQTLIKININSLPGNYGSPYSIFYSKANYNAITSCGRALIGFANSEIEAVLGGNFAWYTIDELINHLVSQLTHGINDIRIRNCMEKYGLKWVTAEELMSFYKTSMMQYKRTHDYSRVEALLAKCTREQIQYFYYFENLRHIFMENDAVFRPWLNNMFDITKVKMDPSVKPDDLFEVNGDLVTFANVAFHKHVDPEDPKIQVYDLPKARPDLAIKFVCIARYLEQELKYVDELFDVFVYTPLNRPKVATRKYMMRDAAVISDTDSVIFTVKDWVAWYTGDQYSIADEAYQIACCMIYWITKAVAHALALYSIAHGARGKFIKTMAMKNEFLYPSMVLAKKKKHYAGIVAVQEGVILPKPDTDIKGVQFKGSDICKEATTFALDFITWGNKELYQHGVINAHEAIEKIKGFENKIRNDIKSGDTSWFEPMSIKNKEYYKNPMSSDWYCFYAWEEMFSHKYGHISIPSKCPAVIVNKPTAEYMNWLYSYDSTVAKKVQKFIETNARWPKNIAISAALNKIPPELIPLVCVTEIIHSNVRPCHLFLTSIGVSVGFNKSQLLFSAVYPNQD